MISLVGVSKHYGDRTLFDGVNLTISISESIGLIGLNGSGKTTLLEILAGRMDPDEGSVSRNKRATVGYLPQEVPKYTGRSLMEEMLAGHERLDHLQRRLELIEEEIRTTSDPGELEELAVQHGELERRFDESGGYDLATNARKILGGLAFRDKDFGRDTSEFSGGWLMRLGLARLLLVEPDLLLLDEPTNYLDLESVIWLEEYLRRYDGSMVIVSHDRVLLNNLVGRVLEIDQRKITGYSGNYDAYLRARSLREEGLAAELKAQEREIAQNEAFIERFRYKKSKAKQVQSRIKRLEKLRRVELAKHAKEIRLLFPDPPPAPRVQLELREVWKSYGALTVYEGIDLRIERGDRLVLVGPNGAGKSTLLRMLAGELAPTRGERVVRPGTMIGYYAQHQVEALDFRRTVMEEVSAATPELLPEKIRGILGRFLFSGDDVFKPISVLSGGEKARVALAKFLAHPPNLMLLDEPTSHLDIPSIDILLDALVSYAGSLVMISHDRHLIETLAERVIEVGEGRIRSFVGGYREFLEVKEQELAESASGAVVGRDAKKAGPEGAVSRGAPRRTREEKRREAEARNLRYRRIAPIKQELETLEKEIEELTDKLEETEITMADPSFYQSGNPEETIRGYRVMQAEIESKTARWEELTAQLEELEGGTFPD